MHSVGRLFAALAIAMLGWCMTLPADAADRPTPQKILRDWYYLMNELVRHTATYSPPVASRSFGYLGVTAFEAAAGGSDRLVSLVGQLQGFDSVPGREAGAVYTRGPDWKPHVVTDGLLVTGQNPASSEEAAQALLKLMKTRS